MSGYRHSDTQCNCPRIATSLVKLELASEEDIDSLVSVEYEELYEHLHPDRRTRGCVWCKLKCAISRKLTSNLWDI